MSAALSRFVALDLHMFSSERAYVAFSPETLQIFVLNAVTESILTQLRTGKDIPSVATATGITAEVIEGLISRIAQEIDSAPPAHEQEAPTPRRGLPLAKLVLMVNNYCNLKCTYCYEHDTVFSKPVTVMTKAIVDTSLERFYDAFTRVGTLMFIGGEPTVNPEIVEYACERALHVAGERAQTPPALCMISNGTRMDDGLLGVMRRFKIQTTFSVDGPKQVNDSVRIRHDNSGSFDAVSQNIKRYAAEFPGDVGLECTITAAHQKAGISIKDVLEFAATEFGVNHPHIGVAGLPSGHPLNAYSSRGGAEMVQQFEEAAKVSVANLLRPKVVGTDDAANGAALDTVGGMLTSLLKKNGPVQMCPAGTTQLTVDAMGDVYPCWMFAGMNEFRMGNVTRDDVFGELARKVLNRIAANTKRTNPQCSSCFARYSCSACIGNNHNTTGRIEAISEEFCNSVRSTLKSVIFGVAESKKSKREAH